MSKIRFQAVDEATLEDWQLVHNAIIPTDPLSLDDIRERVTRNRLRVAYLDDVLIGCSTVRPPVDGAATVIVRVLAEHRRRGHGAEFFARELAAARELGAEVIETIVLESNVDGMRFAVARGFVEVERYLPPGDEHAFVTLRLPSSPLPA